MRANLGAGICGAAFLVNLAGFGWLLRERDPMVFAAGALTLIAGVLTLAWMKR